MSIPSMVFPIFICLLFTVKLGYSLIITRSSPNVRLLTFNKCQNSHSNLCISSSSTDSFSNLDKSSSVDDLQSVFRQIKSFLFESTAASGLILLTGATTAISIVKTKQVIAILESYRKRYPTPFPVIGGIFISLLYLLRKDLNSSGPAALYQKNVMYFRQLFRVVAVVIAVGFGNSLAIVGVAAELGMTIGRFYLVSFAKFLKWSRSRNIQYVENLKTKLIPIVCAAGAAAGVAANFDAPLTGVFFALEITRRLDPSLAAANAAAASITSTTSITSSNNNLLIKVKTHCQRIIKQQQWLVKLGVIFCALVTVFTVRGAITLTPVNRHFLNEFTYRHGVKGLGISSLLKGSKLFQELPQFAILGAFSGLIASLFEWIRDIFSTMFRKLPSSDQLGPLIASAVCSVLSYFHRHQALSHGFAMMKKMMAGELVNAVFLLGFFVERLMAVALCSASKSPGGVFAPNLFIGSSFAACLYSTLTSAVPVSTQFLLNRSLFTLLGAAGVLSGVFRAPFTAAVFILELTRQLNLLVPLIVTATVASRVATKVTQYRLSKFKSE